MNLLKDIFRDITDQAWTLLGMFVAWLVLDGSARTMTGYAIIATTGMIFGAVYMLWLYGKVMLGVLNKTHVKSLVALNNYEVIIFIPLILIVLLLGVYPSILTDLTKTTFLSLINYINFYA